MHSTFGGAVYLDASGKIVSKNDTSALVKISRAEAEKRGLLAQETEPVEPETAEEPKAKAVRPARNKAVSKAEDK